MCAKCIPPLMLNNTYTGNFFSSCSEIEAGLTYTKDAQCRFKYGDNYYAYFYDLN